MVLRETKHNIKRKEKVSHSRVQTLNIDWTPLTLPDSQIKIFTVKIYIYKLRVKMTVIHKTFKW